MGIRCITTLCLALALGCSEGRGSSGPEEPATDKATTPQEKGKDADSPKKPDASDDTNPLLNPESPKLNEKAPDSYKAKFEMSRGDVIIEVTRDSAPRGADRFYNLVKNGFFDDQRFFRVVPGFIVQWGIHGDPKVSAIWREADFTDDPVKWSNLRGTITFATSGPNSRTTQMFINFGNNRGLDRQGFSPFGKVIKGMEHVDAIYSGYAQRPDQGRIQAQGNEYLKKEFPKLDFIKKTSILKE